MEGAATANAAGRSSEEGQGRVLLRIAEEHMYRSAGTFEKLRRSGASRVLLTLSVATNSGRSEPSVCTQRVHNRLRDVHKAE